MSEDQQAYNAGDAQQVAKREKKAKIRQLEKDSALRALLGAPEGRAWMWDLLEICRVHVSCFSSEGNVMAFQEGQRNIGLILEAQIFKVNPELYLRMIKENGGYQPGS
jgi:hypothetical protein